MDALQGWIVPLGGVAVVLLYAYYLNSSNKAKPTPSAPAVVDCPDCGGKVSSKIKACPHCGRPRDA